MSTKVKTLAGLHVLLAATSVSSVFSKLAAAEPFLSPRFVLYYGLTLAVLAVYALGWQQVIKRIPLTTAYANKAASVVWGVVLGVVLFGEKVTPLMVLGLLAIVVGVVLYAVEEGRSQPADLQDLDGALGVPEEPVDPGTAGGTNAPAKGERP